MNLVKTVIITTALVAAAAIYAEAGITVTPDRHIAELSAGESKVVIYEIHNAGSEDIDMTIEPQDWSNVKKSDIYSWLFLKENKLTVKAGQSAPLSVELKAPSNIKGELLAMLFLCYKESQTSPLNIRNGIPLYLVVKGSEKYDIKIRGIYTDLINEEAGNRLDITVAAENIGNIHIAPDIEVVISDAQKQKIKEFSLKAPHIILRGKSQNYLFNCRISALPDGDYTIAARINYEDKIKDIEAKSAFSIKDRKIKIQER